MKIISQSCSPLCRILAHEKQRGAQSLHQGPGWVTHRENDYETTLVLH